MRGRGAMLEEIAVETPDVPIVAQNVHELFGTFAPAVRGDGTFAGADFSVALRRQQLLDAIERRGNAPATLEGAIFVGANAIDYSGYPDCRPEFYEAITEVIRLGSKVGAAYGVPIRIEAPIITMSKADIVRYGADIGAPLELTWSCYAGLDRPCGACDSCELRAAGFAAAGISDPALAVR